MKKVRVGLLTFHRAYNCGAVLQTLGLQQKLNVLGASAEIIDYRCESIERFYADELRLPRFRKNIPSFMRDLRKWRKNRPFIKTRNENFCQCMDKHYQLGPVVTKNTSKRSIENIYDLIITGSDQIWNEKITGGIDLWYFFSSSQAEKKYVLAAYAASTGDLDSFSRNSEKKCDVINGYDLVSVREKDAATFLESKIGKTVQHICDPTLLMDEDFWGSLISEKPLIREGYVFYYDAAPNDIALKVAVAFSTKKQIKLVHNHASLIGKPNTLYVGDMGPLEFLNYIKYSDYIVTSSFHGTVFSILFHKRFVSVAHPVMGGRIVSLLSDVCMNEHIYRGESDAFYDILEREPNYAIIDENVASIRLRGEGFLRDCINLAEKQK